MTPPPTTTYCARSGRSPAEEDDDSPAREAAGLMAVKSSDMQAPCHCLNRCSIACRTPDARAGQAELAASSSSGSTRSSRRERSSERRKSRVATSPTAIRSEATSRARNSMSAWARALASRSCWVTRLSRASWRFCASRISGAAYDACRLRISVRKMNGYSSNRRCCGASVFQATQNTTTTVIHIKNRAVPMNRANCSAKTPKASRSYDGVGISARRCSRGVSRRLPRRSATVHLRDGGGAQVLVAPVLRQHVVEQVVDGDRAQEASGVVDNRRGHQVVRREVRRDLVDRGLGVQGVHRLVQRGGDQRRRRLAQQPLEVRHPEQSPGR